MPIIIFAGLAVVLALLFFGLFLRSESRYWSEALMQRDLESRRVTRDLISAQRQAAGAQHASAEKLGDLVGQLGRAAEFVAPVRNVPCKACAGTGEVEKESPLWKAVRESLDAGNHRARRK